MSSSSFNEMPQPPLNEVQAGTINAISRWTRGRKPAAPVSIDSSNDEDFRELILSRWLEDIDTRHRYGNNLHLYYDVWITRESKQPFINWSDDGDGKEVNLEQCPRTDQQHQVDLEWIFLIANFVLELLSAAFDQLSSVHKPQFLLLSMLISFAALFICIVGLVRKGQKDKVTWEWKATLPWLYYPLGSHKPFGSFKGIIGLVCALCHCAVTTINYEFCGAHADNPIKISVWPISFLPMFQVYRESIDEDH